YLCCIFAVTIICGCSKTNNLIKDIYFLGKEQRIYGVNIIDKEPQIIVNQHSWDISVSPDGKNIAYLSPDSNEIYQLFITSIVSKENNRCITMLKEAPVVLDGNFTPVYSWSPDGKNIVCYTGKDLVIYDIISFKNDTLPINVVEAPYTSYIYGLRWSPAGDFIACLPGEDVFTYSIKSKKWFRVTNRKDIGGTSLCWSNDGRYLLYCQNEKTYLFDVYAKKEMIVYDGEVQYAQFTSDKMKIIYVDFYGTNISNLFSIDINTKEVKQLTNNKLFVADFTLLNDTIIVYDYGVNKEWKLMCLNLKNLSTHELIDTIFSSYCLPTVKHK
ncbi:MAG: hypothetical protein Q7U71_04160, partial [bacterium]|nr:hypothetical protein [bacterium]